MQDPKPTFSLILATYGRGRALTRFFDSLLDQDASFEVIVVDQNKAPHFDLVEKYSRHMAVRLIRASPGLSAARNVGIRAAHGSIIAFPDDDCWYPKGLLAIVEKRLRDEHLDGLTCRCTDEQGRLAAGSEDRQPGPVTKRNVWRRGVSATLFMRERIVKAIGYFDETLGLGARTEFQSGEETDYLLRAIDAGFTIEYDPSLSVFHPLPTTDVKMGAIRKSKSYALGMGRVLRMHEYGRLDVAQFVVVPLFGAAVALILGKSSLARVRYVRAIGRYQGWRSRLRRD